MSGIVNSAGSKAGVIGETELDYEEGTFTPTNHGGTVSMSKNTVYYTKIGRIVNINVYVDLGSDGDGTVMQMAGMPFASATNAYASTVLNAQRTNGKHIYARINPASTVVGFYNMADQGAIDESEVDNGHFIFTLTYTTAG